MKKRHGAILIAWLLVFQGLVLMIPFHNLSPFGNAKAPQPPAIEDDVTYWDGDWDVDSDAVYRNQTIIVNGNLTVRDGFSLTLINVTIKMNNTGNMSTFIHVNNSATLIITDYDNDPLTVEDGCLITSNNTDDQHRYGINAHQNSGFSMINSEISQVGHSSFADDETGIYIHTTNSVIRNCTISRGYRGIYVFEGSNVIIENCLLNDLEDDGISIHSSSDTLIYNNTISIKGTSDHGIYAYSDIWRNRIIKNTINVSGGNSEGIRIGGSGRWNEIEENKINVTGAGNDAIRIFSSYTNVTSNTIHAWEPAGDGIQLDFGNFNNIIDNYVFASGNSINGILIVGVNNITILNNNITVNQNSCKGIEIGFSARDITIENTNITVTSGTNNNGIYCTNAYDIMIVNSTISGAQRDIDLDTDSYVTALNTIFSTYDVSGSPSELTVQQYLHLSVEDYNGIPMPQAQVRIRNTSGITVFNGPVDTNGRIQYLTLTEVIQYSSISDFNTPHNVTVTANGYDPWEMELTMNQEQNITATLLPLGVTSAQKRGDWWIDTTEEYWNTTFLLDGNITINATGSLILHNCTIMFNCSSFSSQYHLNVTWGGELHVFDNDWDNYTIDDASLITDSPYDTDDGSPNDYVFSFYAWDGSTLEIRNSHIIDCGWDAPLFHDKGIYVETDSAEFNHAYIQGGFIGIIFANSVGSIVKNSTININGYSDFSCAIRAWNSPNLQILYNNVVISTTQNDDMGIYVGYSTGSIIEGNQVNMYGTQGWNIGIFLAESRDYIVNNNNVSLNAAGAGLHFLEMDRCQVSGNNIFSFVDYCNAIDLYNLTNSLLNRNTMDMNGAGIGLFLGGFFDNTIIENQAITGNADFINGIFLGDAHMIKLSNISIDLNGLGNFGFHTLYSDNISFTNLTMNIQGAWGAGVVLNRTNDCLLESLSISTNGIIPAFMGINCSNIWILNSTLNAQTTSDIDLSQNSSLFLINTTFSDVSIIDPFTVLMVMWYLNVQVRDALGQPYPGINISVLWPDATEVVNVTTDGNGWLKWAVCIGYVQNETLLYNTTNPHTVRAFNATIWDEIQVDLTYGGQTAVITLGNDDPIITDSISNIQVEEDSFYYNTFHATDKEGNPLIWSINTSLSWISIDPLTGNLTITPSDDNVGIYSFIIKATDINGGYDEFTFTLEILNRAPVILSLSIGVAVEDLAYSRDFDSDDDPNTIWVLENGPAWLNMNISTGKLSGTPDNSHVGIYPVNISVGDYHGGITYSEFNLWVINAKPTITISNVLTASEDVLYQVDYDCSDDGQGSITWSLIPNATWLSIDTETGLLSGTPIYLDIGDWDVHISVHDGNGGWGYSNFTLTVINTPPIITTEDGPWADEDSYYYVDYSSSDDGEGNINWSLNTNALWLSINSTTGALSGIPHNEHVGLFWVNVTVDDGFGDLGWHNFSLTVNNTNDPPVITTTDILSAIEDQLYFVIYLADDDEGDTLNWSLDTSAVWLSINSNSGELSGTPTYLEVGSWEVTVSCDDNNSGSDSHSFSINVAAVNDVPVITYHLPSEMYPTVEEGLYLDFNISYFDEDGDSLSIDWILDGEIIRQDVPFWSFQPLFGSAGDHDVIVNISDDNGASSEHRWIVIVTQANRPPQINEYSPMNLMPVLDPEEESMTFSVNGSDPDNDVLTYQWFINGNDTGVRSSTFTLDRSVYDPGTYDLSVRATDENGSSIEQSWEIEVMPLKEEENEAGFLIPLLILVAIAAVVISVLMFFIWKKKQSKIEDIFIITNTGLLLAHRSKELSADRDDEILGSMLTAVQDFVKDSFKDKSKYGLKRLDFGDSVIHITRGKYVYMAVILSGKEPPDLEDSLEKTVSKVETKYEDILEDWGGELDDVRGMKDMIDDLLK
jgi:parallel beta-helix repeat protein